MSASESMPCFISSKDVFVDIFFKLLTMSFVIPIESSFFVRDKELISLKFRPSTSLVGGFRLSNYNSFFVLLGIDFNLF